MKRARPASETLEYAFDDWTIARMAQVMGRTDWAALRRRAANWRDADDPRRVFYVRAAVMAARTLFDPAASGYATDYTEGNAWQYSWYVPQDVAGLARAHGGAAHLLAQLDQAFDARSIRRLFAHMEDITGLDRLVRARQRAESPRRLPVRGRR